MTDDHNNVETSLPNKEGVGVKPSSCPTTSHQNYTTPPPLLFRPSSHNDNNGDDNYDEYEQSLISENPPSLYQASPISSLWIAILTYITSFRVACAHLITYETLIVASVSAASVVFYSLLYDQSSEKEPLVAKLSLSFMSFIIVFPITANIGYAFVRREKALLALANIKTYVIHIYIAHRDWAFDAAKSHKCKYSARNIINVTLPSKSKSSSKSKEEDDSGDDNDTWDVYGGDVSQKHVDEVRHVMVTMIRAMRNYLSLPLAGRNRHMYTRHGSETRAILRPIQQQCLYDVYENVQRLSLAVERMKEAGMPGNEAARINQYHTLLMKEWELTRFIKSYRTPTGLRAFARVYILLHPLFVGPYYAWVAGAGRGDTSDDSWPFQTSLGFAIALAIFTAVAMQGLFNIEVGLEDPFDEWEGLDNVRIEIIFQEIERLLQMEWGTANWNSAVMSGKPLYDVQFKQEFGIIPNDSQQPSLIQAKEELKKKLNSCSCF